jgi:hypothetical protein
MFSADSFSGHYDEYYGMNTDTESLVYLMIANHMLHKCYPSFMITVAEVSGCSDILTVIDCFSHFACAFLLFCRVHSKWLMDCA